MKPLYFSLFIFLILVCHIKCAYKHLDKEEFYSMLKKDKRGLEYYNRVIDNLKKILNYYVYIDLIKNPPQPEHLPDYHPKVDTHAELEKIRSEISNETYFYDFFRKIRFLIDSYKDAHMSYGLKGFPSRYSFLCPVKLKTIEPENGTAYMTAEINYNDPSFFKNGTEVFEIIKENIGEPILEINGQSPFDFIQNFGGKFFKLKNPQANYAFQTHQYAAPYVIYFPFNENELAFSLTYANGTGFQTEYAIVETVNNANNENNLKQFFNDINIENEFMNYLENYFSNNEYGVPKGLNELIIDFEKSKGIHNDLAKSNIFLYKDEKELFYRNILTEDNSKNSNIKWDYEYSPGNPRSFQCRVDNDNKLNVIHMPTFDFKNVTLIVQLIKNCVELFDKNEYKIVIILNFNGGGVEYVAQNLIEYIQPNIPSQFFSTFRYGEYLDRYYDINFTDHSIVETCKVPDKKYILENIISIDYGEGIINNVTKPLRRFGQHREEFIEEKKKLKNKRKPNEIIVFTDGYSASSASLFTKSLQNEGGAIIVGYNGNPVSGDIFDGSQHFSSVFNYSDLTILEKDLMKQMENDDIYFTQICRTNNLFDYENLEVPEEFNIIKVDEVANIYEAYSEDENYQKFMDKANQIFNQYIEGCNTRNHKLTLLDDKCTFQNDKYAHGGHPCGNSGAWDLNTCIQVYCDEGYYLDDSQCIRDPCVSKKEESLGENIKINKFIVLLMSLILLF